MDICLGYLFIADKGFFESLSDWGWIGGGVNDDMIGHGKKESFH